MKKTLRRRKSGYALSFLFWFFGLATLSTVLWKTWPQASTQNPLSVFWESLWRENLEFLPGIQFKLVYLAALGTGMLIAGAVILALSRQWLLLAGEKSLFKCPFCGKRWKASPDKALVHCPHCRQLIHPQLVEK